MKIDHVVSFSLGALVSSLLLVFVFVYVFEGPNNKQQIRYHDPVIIQNGFYKGLTGQVRDYIKKSGKFEVVLSNDGRCVRFNPQDLKKLRPHNDDDNFVTTSVPVNVPLEPERNELP